MSAQRDGRNIQDGGSPLLGSLENSATVSAKLEHHTDQYRKTRPSDAAADFQAKIDSILAPLFRVHFSDSRTVNQAFKTAQGQLVNLGKQSEPANQALRTAALDFARKGLEAFPVAKKIPTTIGQIDFNNSIGDKSKLPTNQFLEYLHRELQPNSTTNWRAVNAVTALYNLSKYHPYWPRDPLAPVVARFLIERLDTLASQEKFNAQTVCNLAHAMPSVNLVFRLHKLRDPSLESKMFNGVTRAIENLPEFPEEHYVKNSFLMPLREVNALALSPEGATALCGYTDQLNQLIARIKYINSLEIISMSYHGLNGIFAWHASEQNQTHLTSVLRSLNDRLEKNTEPLSDIPAGSILYGLRGVETAKLSGEAQAEVARMLTLVAEKILAKPPGESFRAITINSMFTGLITSLSTHTEPIRAATIAVLDAITMRLPEPPTGLSDLGLLCGAMVILRRTYSQHVPYINRIAYVIDSTKTETLRFNRHDPSDHIAWQNVHQMYALYERQQPEPLRRKLGIMESAVDRATQPSWAERRVGAELKNFPEVEILPEKFEQGFEMDFKVLVRQHRRKINIEVDGVHHKEPTQRLMDNLRDAFFRRAGWEVYRVNAEASQQEISDVLSSIISGAPVVAPKAAHPTKSSLPQA